MTTYFVTGIDTDTGKSIVTGLMARFLRSTGVKYITAKMTQTGCKGIAEDILTHRKLENIEVLPEDLEHKTCPYIFDFPASPHLAAELENREIDPEKIKDCVNRLAETYNCILLEGAGGLMVPLTRDLLVADFIARQNYSLILVSSGKLGSINHTLLTLEAAVRRNIPVAGVVYNEFPKADPVITEDSRTIIVEWLKKNKIEAPLIRSPFLSDFAHPPFVDFSDIFKEVL